MRYAFHLALGFLLISIPFPPHSSAATEQERSAATPLKLTEKVDQLIRSAAQNQLTADRIDDMRQENSEQLLSALHDFMTDEKNKTEQRWFAAIALAKVGGHEAAPLLMAAAKDRSFFVRMASIKGIEITRTMEALPLLHQTLSDDRAMVVRAAVADTLGMLGSRVSAEALANALFAPKNFHRGKSLWVRKNIIRALGHIGGEAATAALVRCLSENNADVRREALQALNPTMDLEKQMVDTDAASQAWLAWHQAKARPAFDVAPVEDPTSATNPAPGDVAAQVNATESSPPTEHGGPPTTDR